MAGVRRRLQREREERLTLAWETAALSAQAQRGKLDPLERYLERVRPRAPRTGAEILQIFRDLAAQGADIAITPTTH